MRVINKKMVVVVLLIIEFTCGYLMYQSSKKAVDLAKVTYEEEIKDSMFAMYVENEDTGEYDEVTNANTFPEGYILNMDKTGCIDNKGNSISDILTSKDDKVMVKSNKTVFCYLYFDKDNRVYTQVKSDYKNNTGALLLSETESDEYPVYYYNGNITNNNILYANFCWKMVRTTETGGVKLIYNGVPDESEDGTLTCDNTGEESAIGTSIYNRGGSLAYVGYMYNEVYPSKSVGMVSLGIFSFKKSQKEYYYADTAIWNETTQKYELSNSNGAAVSTYVWENSYSDLVGYYTCLSITETECASVYYITSTSSTRMYHYILSEGKTKDDYKLKLATSIVDNGDETYTLVEPVEVSKADWPNVHSNYKNYYICGDLISETCENMYFSIITGSTQISGYNVANNYKYGNSFEYKDELYTLVNTKEFWNWPENYNTLNNNHYTCFNTSGECEQIYYIYRTDSTYANYITLSDGEFVEDAINKMLYADDVNKTDSTMKNTLDIWYENNIVDILDLNSVLYSSYLENTIWCSGREITDLGGWNPNGGDTTKYLYFDFSSLGCNNKLDQFTLKVEAGGTEGYGNNALDYPIGLLTYKEVEIAPIGLRGGFWTLTTKLFTGIHPYIIFDSSGSYVYSEQKGSIYVRPAVSLSNKVEITSGNGTIETPYQIILPI